MSSADPRVEHATALLREAGIRGRVEVRGLAGDIAALVVPEDQHVELVGERGAELTASIRALGFRYVALDLDPAADPC